MFSVSGNTVGGTKIPLYFLQEGIFVPPILLSRKFYSSTPQVLPLVKSSGPPSCTVLRSSRLSSPQVLPLVQSSGPPSCTVLMSSLLYSPQVLPLVQSSGPPSCTVLRSSKLKRSLRLYFFKNGQLFRVRKYFTNDGICKLKKNIFHLNSV
jgi:hypothetical protein